MSKDRLGPNFSNFESENIKTDTMEEIIGGNIDSIKYDYSITNNNSFESVHQRLKGSEFGFHTKETEEIIDNSKKTFPTDLNEEYPIRQPEIKFSGFYKSQTRIKKQNMKKSPTVDPIQLNQKSVTMNKSLNNLESKNTDIIQV